MLEEGHGVYTVVVEELWLARIRLFRHVALQLGNYKVHTCVILVITVCGFSDFMLASESYLDLGTKVSALQITVTKPALLETVRIFVKTLGLKLIQNFFSRFLDIRVLVTRRS